MAFDFLQHAVFTGPAFPEPFVRFELERELNRLDILPKTTGEQGRQLQETWASFRRKLRELVSSGGPVRVKNHVIDPLIKPLGYEKIEDASDITTREGQEQGGYLLVSNDARLRVWITSFAEDLDAPAKRGRAYRFSHVRIAQRVLLTTAERVGLITNGTELRILISDPARTDSQIEIRIDPNWRKSRDVPECFCLFLALASPEGIRAIPDLIDKARLQQTRVTKELRVQARQAIEGFIQEILGHPDNREYFSKIDNKERLARELWREGLVVIYRLLFIFKLEASDDPARLFSFASTSLWRNSFSPSISLAPHVKSILEQGMQTGSLLEDGLKNVFRLFNKGLQCTELNVKPLGGGLFGTNATLILSNLCWGENAVAILLDRLLWTSRRRGSSARERVHYGSLDVEDLGRVYEALLELEPGITKEPMCRLRRRKLEVVVPISQGDRYRHAAVTVEEPETDEYKVTEEDDEYDEVEEEQAPYGGKQTRVEWVEEIPSGRFYLRVGLGRKASGSFYTPHSFVRFLVQETLGPQVAERSPQENPRPVEILRLKVLDPAMGSGHLLVQASRFLGEKLYEACRLCDEKVVAAEQAADQTKSDQQRIKAKAEAEEYRRRLFEIPDPDEALISYLPSRAPEGEESGLSQKKAEAICRRLVAVHCLYGVDKNPLAVELAKLAIWIESHAEGLPLTFLDHRFVVGDSLTGPFFEHLLKYPGAQQPMEDLFTQGLKARFTKALNEALQYVATLEAALGLNLSEMEAKQAAKERLDRALAPFRIIAAAWAGGVMLGNDQCDDMAYAELVRSVTENGDLPEDLSNKPLLLAMIAKGLGMEDAPANRQKLLDTALSGDTIPALPYELVFPEVFYPDGTLEERQGFHAAVGNPPWDKVRPKAREFFATYDFTILDAATKRERTGIEKRLKSDPEVSAAYNAYLADYDAQHRIYDTLYRYQVALVHGKKTGGDPDLSKYFLERNAQLLCLSGLTGVVAPSAFHANEGFTGIRRLYLEEMALLYCYSFENRRKLFEIDSRFKFALVVASRIGPTVEFPCAFYLHDDQWLFGKREDQELRYSLPFVRRTGGDYLSLLEPRTSVDFQIISEVAIKNEMFGDYVVRREMRLSRELHTTDDAWRFVPLDSPDISDPRNPENLRIINAEGALVLAEGRMFNQFDDRWGVPPRYAVPVQNLHDKATFVLASRYYRLAYRTISASTNERTAIFCILPPGYVTAVSCPCDATASSHPASTGLNLLAVANSFCFDYLLRQCVSSATLNYFFLARTPIPQEAEIYSRFFVHSSLRLTCNHAGYEPLWREQLGDVYREPKSPFNWPVLETDDERWSVRAAVDAVAADAYGLSRDQYAHILSSFSHRSYPKALEFCLARFDELKSIDLEAFTKKYDPYWDISLNENLPKPVIDLPIPNNDYETTDHKRKRRSKAPNIAFDFETFQSEEKYQKSESDTEAYELIKLLLEEKETITSFDAQELTRLNAAAVRPVLQRLLSEGLAVQEGQRRGVKYRFTGKR